MFVGQFADLTHPVSIAVSDSLAYIADADSGLYVINVSDPANPDTVDLFDIPGTAKSVAVADVLAYVYRIKGRVING